MSYMGGKGYSRGTNAKNVNQWSGHANDGRLVDKGRGPTVGNKGTQKPVMPPQCHTPGVNPGKDMFKGSQQVRNPSGTRSWDPKAKQNYKGNPNSINVGRGPTKGNQ